jgi:carbon-monoxide dehydrogenase small subunit
MTPLRMSVNGAAIAETVEPRTHLADFLRDALHLTATHLRCEQGVCGACTILVDGEPVRSCITYAVQYADAEVTTLEGLADDPVIERLREAFSAEHGLQCGYCTPGMLVTARDIVLRLPEADEARVRLELSGNLCRCTGYHGIVAAIMRVLAERRAGTLTLPTSAQRRVGPVGAVTSPRLRGEVGPRSGPGEGDSRRIQIRGESPSPAPPSLRSGGSTSPRERGEVKAPADLTDLGLAGRKPNFEIERAFTIARPPDEVWAFFDDIAAVVSCLPGAALTGPTDGDRITGRMAVKLGPITTDFSGEARLTRDAARRRGTIAGSGRDRLTGSRAAADVDYQLHAADGGTRVEVTVRAMLAGALAQFGRSGIVDDLATRLTETFARNLERRLAGAPAEAAPTPLAAGAMLRSVLAARLRAIVGRITGRRPS